MSNYGIEANQIHLGDCLDVMVGIKSNAIDTVITDPPYGLSGEPDIAEVMQHWINGDDYRHRGGGFMGRSWDSFVPGPAIWREVYRVMKPGGAMLAFGGTRTVDLLSIAIRFAGFRKFDEISFYHGGLPPILDWTYGSGFPKSTDISKAIDKAAGEEREVVGEHIQSVRKRKLANSLAWGSLAWQYNITAPATEAARTWAGWGTALKPSHEVILCFYKPRDGTFAENAQRWGVAGLNIDGGRVEADWENDPSKRGFGYGWDGDKNGQQKHIDKAKVRFDLKPYNWQPTKGRWPANVILDNSPEVLAGFPETSQNGYRKNPSTNKTTWFGDKTGSHIEGERGYADTGSAARFFQKCETDTSRFRYCPKASPAERGDYNDHPTVKPLALMEYLCRLTKTPYGGVVLDPFCGSGTTALGCIKTNRPYILIDSDPHSVNVARRRVADFDPLADFEPVDEWEPEGPQQMRLFQ